jgi:hypothetical protein
MSKPRQTSLPLSSPALIAAMLPAPGSMYGPCQEPCEHPACEYTRGEAAKVCRHCAKPIGYATRFHAEAQRKLVHAACAEGYAP